MSPTDIQRAFEDRQHAVAELRRLVEETEASGEEFSGEQQAEYEAQNRAIDSLDERIKTGLSLMQREAKATEALDQFRALGDLTTPTERAEAPKVTDNDLFRQLLRGEIRSFESKPEQRDLTKGSAGAGGNLVTDVLYDRVIEKFTEEGVALRAGATLLNTASGEDMLIPTVSSYSTGSLVAEGGTIGESDPAFGQATLATYKFAAIVDCSSELIEDQGVGNFNVLSFIGDQGGAAVGRALSAEWTSGSGSSRPYGFDTCSTGVTAAATGAITANELIDLQHSVTAPYRQGAAWAMKDTVLVLIRKLVDSNGQYVWQPGLRADHPDVLLGNPVHTDVNMASPSTGETTVVYGNFTRGYFARIAGGIRVESTNADKWTTDLVSVRFIVRGGGNLVDTNALRKLVQA
jgi:HK97 family phage major capsid protein